jgi:hypothetical protein
MANFTNNTFVGQQIQIDGNEFKGNVFTNCVLIYGGGSLTFVDNRLNGVRWEFVDAAARTIALLGSFYQGGGESRTFVESMLATMGKTPSPPIPAVSAATA